MATGANTATLADESDYDQQVWIDNMAALLVAGNTEGVVTVWSIAQRKELKRFTLDGKPRIRSARLTADKKKVTIVTDQLIRILEFATGRLIRDFSLPPDYSFHSLINDDEVLVARKVPNCASTELRYINLKEDMRIPLTVIVPTNCSKSEEDYRFGETAGFLDARGESIFVVRRGSSEITEWNLRTRTLNRAIRWANSATDKVIAVHGDQRLALTHDGNQLRLHNLDTGNVLHELTGLGYGAESAASSHDGRLIVLGHGHKQTHQEPKDVTLWVHDQLRPQRLQVPVSSSVSVLDVSAQARIAVGADELDEKGNIIVFSTETGRVRRTILVPGIVKIYRAWLSPDGKSMIVIGVTTPKSDDTQTRLVVLLNVEDGKVRRVFGSAADDDQVTGAAFSKNGSRFAILYRSGKVEIWNTDPLRRHKVLSTPNDEDLWSVAFAKNGSVLVASSEVAPLVQTVFPLR